jgi:hypothetical protein
MARQESLASLRPGRCFPGFLAAGLGAGRVFQAVRALRLDTPTPESHERRRIVASRAGLTQIRALMDIPRDSGEPRAELTADVLYGGRMVRRYDSEGNRFEFLVELPAPLRRDEATALHLQA